MNQLVKLIVFSFLIFSFFGTAHAFEYKRQGIIAIDYMPDLNYANTFRVVEEYNNKKISLNECVIKGIRLLEKLEAESPNKSMSANDRRYPGNDFDNLYDFLALTYSNYDKLSPEALNVLNSSIWGMGEFLNKQFTSEEIKILNSPGKVTAYDKTKYYDVIDCFHSLVTNGKLTYGKAAVYMMLISEYHTLLPVKINLDNYYEYSPPSPRTLYGWITIHYNEIMKDKHAFRLLQFLYDLHWKFKDRLINNKKR